MLSLQQLKLITKTTVGAENNKKWGGSAPWNPMLATPNKGANSGDESVYIQGDTVDAEKKKNWGEISPWKPHADPPRTRGFQAPSSEGDQ